MNTHTIIFKKIEENALMVNLIFKSMINVSTIKLNYQYLSSFMEKFSWFTYFDFLLTLST